MNSTFQFKLSFFSHDALLLVNHEMLTWGRRDLFRVATFALCKYFDATNPFYNIPMKWMLDWIRKLFGGKKKTLKVTRKLSFYISFLIKLRIITTVLSELQFPS